MVKFRIKPPAGDLQGEPKSKFSHATTNGKDLQKKQPKLKIKRAKSSSKIVLRKSFVGGYGYDSEASDREDDPTIETHMVMRFKTGGEAEFVRNQIEQKNPMDGITVKFKDPRNAVVTVRGKLFAAKLVDLPTITEVHKSFDKKNIFKVADICQMLLVGDRISHEDTVLALPSQPKDYIFPNGLTPPLKNVRVRRFRKRASAKTIESVEKEVDRLLNLDSRCERTTYTIMDKGDLERDHAALDADMSAQDNDDEDEDGVEEMEEGSDYEDLAADLEAQLNSPFNSPLGTPGTDNAAATAVAARPATGAASLAARGPRNVSISTHLQVHTPTLDTNDASSDGSDVESSSSSSSSSNDDDAVDGQGNTVGAKSGTSRASSLHKSSQKALRDSITQLQSVIVSKKADVERAINPIMKQRLVTTLKKFEAELAMKMEELDG